MSERKFETLFGLGESRTKITQITCFLFFLRGNIPNMEMVLNMKWYSKYGSVIGELEKEILNTYETTY